MKDIVSRLKKIDSQVTVNGLKNIGRGYAKYFNLRVEDRKLVIKRNTIAFAMNREGMFVMFSHEIGSWKELMTDYDCRIYIEQAFDVLKNNLDGNRWRTVDRRRPRAADS